mmetsp:Transcript_83087/g.240469  ORF Transcript_83087/g.240469 Transcript_83087/m.240469 type:complete len:239 (+) Transcript_83087:434-1150(+)
MPLTQGVAGARVQYRRAPIAAIRGQPGPVGEHIDAQDGAAEAAHHTEQGAERCVPDRNMSVYPPCGDPAAVREDRNACDPTRVVAKRVQDIAGMHLPNDCGAVLAASDQAISRGEDVEPENCICMCMQCAQEAAGRYGPNGGNAISITSHDPGAAWQEPDADDAVCVVAERMQRLIRRGVPQDCCLAIAGRSHLVGKSHKANDLRANVIREDVGRRREDVPTLLLGAKHSALNVSLAL